MTTIKDIARLAGCSIASVSRVINKQTGVKPEKRVRIERIIEETGFRPNLLARNLLSKRTNVVGIVLPAIHNYYAARIAGITDVCNERRFGLMIASSRENADEELRNFELFYEKQVEGILFFVTTLTDRHIKLLRGISKEIPIVTVGQDIPELEAPSVVPDNYRGARQAVEYLIDQGHREVAFIAGTPGNFSAGQRADAYRDALAERGIAWRDDLVAVGDFSLGSGYAAMKTLLGRPGPRPTAVFVSNDMMAIGGIRALAERGLKVPDDISMIGFDDIAMSEYMTPALTTVRQNHYEIGRQAGELLLECISSGRVPEKRKLILDQALIVRESVKRIG